jgi:hypothetical protein
MATLLRGGWCKGREAQDARLRAVDPLAPSAVAFCVAGAALRAQADLDLERPARADRPHYNASGLAPTREGAAARAVLDACAALLGLVAPGMVEGAGGGIGDWNDAQPTVEHVVAAVEIVATQFGAPMPRVNP